jgi:hypothetical protein
MAVGFPTKANWAAGDVLTASAQDDLAGTVNLLSNASAASGSQLVSNVAGTSFAYQATPSASNPILNSAMQVAQRGTSISVAASSSYTYTLDRWCTTTSANQAVTISQQATGDTTNLPAIQYCLRYQRNSGQTGTAGIYLFSSFESVNSIPFAGKQVTFSFYARAGANYSAASSAFNYSLQGGTGTDQQFFAMSGATTIITGNATLTTTWQRFTATGTVGSTVKQLAPYFVFTPTGTAGTNDYYEVTGVQIDIGSVALPFRTYAATYQGELAACQRYYFRKNTSGVNQARMGLGFATSTTRAQMQVIMPVQMRVTPTSVDYSTVALADGVSANVAVTSIVLDSPSSDLPNVYCDVAAGLIALRSYASVANSTSGYIGFSAEL